MKEVKCDNCNYCITEKEFEDFPECPHCGGHYVEIIEVRPKINKIRLEC